MDKAPSKQDIPSHLSHPAPPVIESQVHLQLSIDSFSICGMNVFYNPRPLGPTFILITLILGLNNQVCDGQTTVDEPCDSLCGGAGCGKCGGISCLDGALSKAGEAVKSAEQADKLLREKDSEAQQILGKISQVCIFKKF